MCQALKKDARPILVRYARILHNCWREVHPFRDFPLKKYQIWALQQDPTICANVADFILERHIGFECRKAALFLLASLGKLSYDTEQVGYEPIKNHQATVVLPFVPLHTLPWSRNALSRMPCCCKWRWRHHVQLPFLCNAFAVFGSGDPPFPMVL